MQSELRYSNFISRQWFQMLSAKLHAENRKEHKCRLLKEKHDTHSNMEDEIKNPVDCKKDCDKKSHFFLLNNDLCLCYYLSKSLKLKFINSSNRLVNLMEYETSPIKIFKHLNAG